MSRSQGVGLSRHSVDATHASAAKAKPPRRSGASDVAASARVSNQAFGQALGSGAPLDATVRAEMETRFGESFADVRIHDDGQAHRSAAALEAKAYTRGADVAFSEGRYAPHAPEGKQLLAHELAHVVQQRRGGAAPELSSSSAHEAGAAQAAAQVAAGASAITVAGATGVGVAREVDDDKKRASSPAPQAPTGPLPPGDAARVLNPGAAYWLTHTPNEAAMKPMELRDEINQINEKLFYQTQSSPLTNRLEEVRDSLELAQAQLPQATAPGAKPRRRRGGKQAAAAATPSGSRPPLTQRNATTLEPARLAKDYNDIVHDLQRKDLTGKEKADLQLELDSIEPLVDQDLVRRSALRYGNVIDEALTPQDRFYGQDSALIERMRRIDRIKPDREHPGLNDLMHGRERIPVGDSALRAIRAAAMRGLNEAEANISEANEAVNIEYGDLMERSFKTHPVVGFISSVRSGENPADWQEQLMGSLSTSNMQLRGFDQMRQAARDPWNATPPSLEEMARKVDAGERIGEGARNYLDYKTGLLYEGTLGAIRHLRRMKTAGQVAASVAFSPLGGALYGATGSTLEQLSEMHYGQREKFDYLAPVIDAAAAYVGGKVTGGLTGGLGKNAPLWLRAAAFVPADRLGAAASTITHGSLDRALGRSDKGLREIMGEAGADLKDWKQAGLNLLTVGLSHAARSSRGGSGGGADVPLPRKTRREPALAKPARTVSDDLAASLHDQPAPTASNDNITQPRSLNAPVPANENALPPHAAPPAPASNDNAPAPVGPAASPDLGKAPANTNVTTPVAPGKQSGLLRNLPAGFHEEAMAKLDALDVPFESGFGAKTQKKINEGAEGKGQRELAPHIDEPLPVGDKTVSLWRRYKRAMDPQNRQFLDPATNSRTKYLGISPEDIARNRNPREPVSLATPGVDASVVFTRRFGEVVELRKVVEQAVSSIRDPYAHSPGKVKKMVNDNIKEIIREGKSPEGAAVRDALRTLGYEYLPGKGLTAVKPRAAGMKPLPTEIVE